MAPNTVTAGLTARATFAITNPGQAALQDTSLAHTLPAGASFVSASSTQGTCSLEGSTVTCLLGTMASGSAATVTIFHTAPSASFESCGTLTGTRAGNTHSLTACDTTNVRPANDPNFQGGCVTTGGTISTGTSAAPGNPQSTSIQSPGEACMTVAEVPATSPTEACGAGFVCTTEISEIEHPSCASTNPCVITLVFDSSFGQIKNVFFNGSRIRFCDPSAVGAVPDPCMTKRKVLAGGDTLVTLLSAIDARFRGG